MKNYCVVQCGVWPLISVMYGIIKFTRNSALVYNHQILILIIVSCSRSILRFNLGYVGCNSFIIETCRHVFTMHATYDEYISIKKFEMFFIAIRFVVPIISWGLSEGLLPIQKWTFVALDPRFMRTQNSLFNQTLQI